MAAGGARLSSLQGQGIRHSETVMAVAGDGGTREGLPVRSASSHVPMPGTKRLVSHWSRKSTEQLNLNFNPFQKEPYEL